MILAVMKGIYAIAYAEAWQSQDFNRVWTCDLAIPVCHSNQLSYEATDWLAKYVFFKERCRIWNNLSHEFRQMSNLKAAFTICSFRNSWRQMNILIHRIWMCVGKRTNYICIILSASRGICLIFPLLLFSFFFFLFLFFLFPTCYTGQYSIIVIILFSLSLFGFSVFWVSLPDSNFLFSSVSFFFMYCRIIFNSMRQITLRLE